MLLEYIEGILLLEFQKEYSNNISFLYESISYHRYVE